MYTVAFRANTSRRGTARLVVKQKRITPFIECRLAAALVFSPFLFRNRMVYDYLRWHSHCVPRHRAQLHLGAISSIFHTVICGIASTQTQTDNELNGAEAHSHTRKKTNSCSTSRYADSRCETKKLKTFQRAVNASFTSAAKNEKEFELPIGWHFPYLCEGGGAYSHVLDSRHIVTGAQRRYCALAFCPVVRRRCHPHTD